jgi:ergothioneine biosynthesis protein EgtB
LKPAYDMRLPLRHAAPPPLAWRSVESGVVRIGHDAVLQGGFCFDNETPRHRQFVEPFALAQRLITNGEYLQFVQAGGYENPSLWMSEGWEWIRSQGIRHPLYWQSADENRWQEFTLHGMQPLDLAAPASHLSWFEADAYARSVEARLPTEAEWECAVTQASQPAGANAQGGPLDLQQAFGACWQWTSSSYAPYPGFAPAGGAIGEYNGKFMCNQYVLRGSSCATPAGHSRASYRNFFPATARWQFSGIRLAKSPG